MLIKDILQRNQEGLEVDVSGWILNIRNQAENCFITLTDGSTSDPFPIYIKKEGKADIVSTICNGCSVHCRGVMVKSPGKGQEFELLVKEDDIELLGGVEKDYPIMKANVTFDYLREHAHLRARTRTFSSIYRIRHRMMMATHEFYDKEGFLLLDPNIITTSECEGGAGVFQLTEKDISVPSELKCIDKSKNYDWSKDHFGKPVYLTVSSQLQLEALAMSMGRVYTVNKSFRSEHSVTHKHVSEFTHLEIEQCFTSLEDLMNISERFVKFVMKSVLEHNRKDLVLLENSAKFNDALDKNVLERYSSITNCDFVFLTHWPIAIKSFYMKQLDDGTCESFDLLMPYRVGELIGASQRETSYDKLVAMMDVKGVKREPLKFYTDLRKYGSCPHGGFGLGCDRLLMLLTGVHNIKDVIPFPVSYQNCQF